MALFSPSSQNPLGLHPGRAEKVRVKMRGGAGSRGNTVRFVLLASDDAAVTASTSFGASTDPTANVLLATGSHTGKETTTVYLYGILAEDIADDGEGWCYIRGVVQALGGDTSAAGLGLTPGTGSELVVIGDEDRCIAIALETMADGELKWVIFDGINGFGPTVDVAA